MATRIHGSLILLLCASAVHSQTYQRNAKPGQLYELKSDKPSAVLVQKPLGMEYRTYWTGNEQVVVFCTGQHKQIVLVVFSNGDTIPDVKQYVIDVDGGVDPEPEPGPDPKPPTPGPDDLTGLAKYIRDKGREVGVSRTAAHAYGANYEAIASKIAAVSTLTAQQAQRDLIELNRATGQKHRLPRAAEVIEKSINEYLNKNGNSSREEYKRIFSIVASGWKAI